MLNKIDEEEKIKEAEDFDFSFFLENCVKYTKSGNEPKINKMAQILVKNK